MPPGRRARVAWPPEARTTCRLAPMRAYPDLARPTRPLPWPASAKRRDRRPVALVRTNEKLARVSELVGRRRRPDLGRRSEQERGDQDACARELVARVRVHGPLLFA